MNRLFKGLTVAALGLATTAVFASPTYLIIHNQTNAESNAYIEGTIDSHQPTKGYSVGKVHWAVVRMICSGHIIEGNCRALIKMETNTSRPVNLGWLYLNIESGAITPAAGLSANGYTLKVNAPGEATITKTAA